ncbi:MmcQ/YjbR family DNA-binding protein [Streptomyces canus]|uniref:MmcQ/YjbR family DNA-binding protein n=1 Tax=Streptomyces canus TaxID=58343 RepID=UPI003405EAE6
MRLRRNGGRAVHSEAPCRRGGWTGPVVAGGCVQWASSYALACQYAWLSWVARVAGWPGPRKVSSKVFLIVTDDPDEQIITVKCEPEHARAHVRAYASITPGRYLDKRHWISVGAGPGITEQLVTDAVEDSYHLAVERLPRRDRPGAR